MNLRIVYLNLYSTIMLPIVFTLLYSPYTGPPTGPKKWGGQTLMRS